jgi:hypothetical protein
MTKLALSALLLTAAPLGAALLRVLVEARQLAVGADRERVSAASSR